MTIRALLAGALSAGLFAAVPAAAQDATVPETTIRIAEADTMTGEDLVQLIAYANAEKRGVKIEVIPLKSDDITFQAVLNGQADVGVGDSYEGIANLKAPLRNFYQVRKLAYVPVVDKTVYKDWKDLDGQPFAVHSRGSGTETLAQIMEKANGIKFSEISYVPGSEVRVVAMQRGNMKATYLDMSSSKTLIDSDPERFGRLPVDAQDASDSTLYANVEFLEKNGPAVQILVEELIKAAQATMADPAWPAAERERLALLPDLPPEAAADITPYFQRALAAGIFPTDGGGADAAKADIAFLAQAGKLDGAAKIEDFWVLAPVDGALAAIKTPAGAD